MCGRDRKLDAARGLRKTVQENLDRQVKNMQSPERSAADRQTQIQSDNEKKKTKKKKEGIEMTEGEEKSLQWNSWNINSESCTAGSHYVGETQASANLTSDCLPMPVCTPLITPSGLCHLLKLQVLDAVCVRTLYNLFL